MFSLGVSRQVYVSNEGRCSGALARTIAPMPALTAGSSVGQAEITAARCASAASSPDTPDLRARVGEGRFALVAALALRGVPPTARKSLSVQELASVGLHVAKMTRQCVKCTALQWHAQGMAPTASRGC